MAYCIDFTAAYYARRRAIRGVLAVLVLAVLGGAGWGARRGYSEWSRPTLEQQLSAYHMLADRIEALHGRWSDVAAAFQRVSPYYQLFWAENATDMVRTLTIRQEGRPVNLTPVRWELNTGGTCVLTYQLRMEERGKREQFEEARNFLVALPRPHKASVTWPEGPLADRKELLFTVRFSLESVKHATIPGVPQGLRQAVKVVADRRDAVLTYALDARGPGVRTVSSALDQVVNSVFAADREAGAHWRERSRRTIAPGVFLAELERELQQTDRAVPDALKALQAEWRELATRRWPWRRAAGLDTPALAGELANVKELVDAGLPHPSLFDGLHERIDTLNAALRKGYSYEAVFDEGDLQRLVNAELAGLLGGMQDLSVSSAPVQDGLMLATWTLALKPSGGGARQAEAVNLEQLISVCRRMQDLQAGFVLGKIVINLYGNSSNALFIRDAVAEGLLAVQKEDREPDGVFR